MEILQQERTKGTSMNKIHWPNLKIFVAKFSWVNNENFSIQGNRAFKNVLCQMLPLISHNCVNRAEIHYHLRKSHWTKGR